jgi:alpha-1,6-mannosyltransferase
MSGPIGCSRRCGLPRALAERTADRLNRRPVREFDAFGCATAFAQAEFDRIGAVVHRVLFGVDLATFTPALRDARRRRDLAAGATLLVVHCGRLSREKHVERSIDTAAVLHRAGAAIVSGVNSRRVVRHPV